MAKPPKNPNGCTNCHRVPPEGLGFHVARGERVAYKQCVVCRSKKIAYNKTGAGKQSMKRANQSELGKLRAKKYHKSLLGKSTRSKYKKTATCKRVDAKYASSAKGKAKKRVWRASANGQKSRQNTYAQLKSNPGAYLWHKMQCKIRKTILSGVSSKTVMKYSGFQSVEDVQAHFSGQLKDGMTMQNSGNDTDDATKWHIGHRIAKAMYNASDAEDVVRCWSKENLFPQWGKENMLLGVALPSDEELLKLRAIWPTGWKDELPNAGRRGELERAARGR